MTNPKYIVCSKCKMKRNLGYVRKCPNEAVIRYYKNLFGSEHEVYICYDCCMHCKHEYEGYMGRRYCELCDKANERETIRYKHYWEDGEFKIERVESNE